MFREFLAYILCLIFSYCPILGDIEEETNKPENYFVTIPHHIIAKKEMEEFYSYIKDEYSDIDNIVIISPNHFRSSWLYLETIENDWNLCFNNNCIKAYTLDNIDKKNDFFKSSFIKEADFYQTFEHWIWEHIYFLNKFFPDSKIYPLIILKNINNPEASSKMIRQIIKNEGLDWTTLYIASVDFSHHVKEEFAVIHDARAVASLNYWDLKWTEVDCPNCLQILHDLAKENSKNCFEIKNRSSVDTITWIQSWYNNTSHIYWEYKTCDSPKTTPIIWIIYWKYFGFEDLSEFYQEWNSEKNPKYYYHNVLTWFDLVAFAWDEIEEFKNFKIDYFIWNNQNIFTKTIRDKNIAFYTINEKDIIQKNNSDDILTELKENKEEKPKKDIQNIDYKSNLNENINIIEDWFIGEKDDEETKINLDDLIEELQFLKYQNDIVILFINRNKNEINPLFYDLSEYADMIVGIWWETKEYERYNDTDIYHSIWNLNEYIIFEVN